MKLKITFKVPENCKASADIYSADNIKLQNLWNQRLVYTGRTYTEWLDTDLPVGSAYKLVLTTNNMKTVWEGVIGNTSLKQSGPTIFWNMQQAQDLDAGVDSYFYCTGYNEGKTSCFRMLKTNTGESKPIYPKRGMNGLHVVVKDGIVYWCGTDGGRWKSYADEFIERGIDKKMTLAAACEGMGEATYDKVKKGLYAVVGAGDLFAGYRKPEYNKAGFTQWFSTYCVKDIWCRTMAGIWASKESDNSQVNFLFGKAYQPSLGMNYPSMIIYEGDLADVTGLAVSDHCIYASFGGLAWGMQSADLIRVYNKQGQLINEVSAVAPKKMIVVDDFLYYCSKKSIIRAKIAEDGTIENDASWSMDLDWTMLDVSFDKLTGTISTASSDGLIRYYDRELNLKSNKGNPINYWDNPKVFDDKFYWEDWRLQYEAFLATDINGLQLIGDGGNQRIQIFDRSFAFQKSIGWLSTSYHVGVVDNRIFSEYLEFERDLASPTSLKWKLVNNWGYNVTYDWDNMYVKLDMPFVLGGKTYARMQSLPYNKIMLVELDPDYGIRFLNQVAAANKYNTLIYPDGCIYSDVSGSGMARINKQQFLTVNADGTFKWAALVRVVNSEVLPAGSAFNNMSKRIFETSGSKLFMYNAHRTTSGYHLTAVDMSTGKHVVSEFPSTHAGYRGEYKNDTFDIGNGVVYPGGQFVVLTVMINGKPQCFIACNYHGEFWGAGQCNKWHIFDGDLVALHTHGTESKTINKQGIPKPAPMMAGNSFSGNFVQDGEYLRIYHNDEGWHSGIHSIRVEGWQTVKKYEFAAQVYNVSDSPFLIFPLKKLPAYGEIKDGDAGWTMIPEASYNINANNRYSVQSGLKFLSKTEPPDLHVYFRTAQSRCIVSYPIDPVSMSKWSFNCMINLEGNYHSRDNGKTMANKLQLLDSAGKVIFELYPVIDYAKRIVKLWMNDKLVFELPESKANKILTYFQTVICWCSNGIISGKFANYPAVILGTIENKPALIRVLMYNTITTTFDQHSSLIRMKFNRR